MRLQFWRRATQVARSSCAQQPRSGGSCVCASPRLISATCSVYATVRFGSFLRILIGIGFRPNSQQGIGNPTHRRVVPLGRWESYVVLSLLYLAAFSRLHFSSIAAQEKTHKNKHVMPGVHCFLVFRFAFSSGIVSFQSRRSFRKRRRHICAVVALP